MRTRAKGVRFEREVAQAFEDAGYHVRGLEAGGDQLCVTREEAPLEVVPPRVLHVECKRHERLRLPEWLEQAKRDAGELPFVVVFRQSRAESYVVQPLKQYLDSIGRS